MLHTFKKFLQEASERATTFIQKPGMKDLTVIAATLASADLIYQVKDQIRKNTPGNTKP